jgi:hypothetical protein
MPGAVTRCDENGKAGQDVIFMSARAASRRPRRLQSPSRCPLSRRAARRLDTQRCFSAMTSQARVSVNGSASKSHRRTDRGFLACAASALKEPRSPKVHCISTSQATSMPPGHPCKGPVSLSIDWRSSCFRGINCRSGRSLVGKFPSLGPIVGTALP